MNTGWKLYAAGMSSGFLAVLINAGIAPALGLVCGLLIAASIVWGMSR